MCAPHKIRFFNLQETKRVSPLRFPGPECAISSFSVYILCVTTSFQLRKTQWPSWNVRQSWLSGLRFECLWVRLLNMDLYYCWASVSVSERSFCIFRRIHVRLTSASQVGYENRHMDPDPDIYVIFVIFLAYCMHIVCIFCAYFVHILCIFMHIMMHISCIFPAYLTYFLHILCIFLAYSLHIPCIFLAYYLHISCHFHAKLGLICHLLPFIVVTVSNS